MVTRDELRRLAQRRHEEGIVSAYVGIRRRLRHERSHPQTAFKGAGKRFLREHGTDGPWAAALERESGPILDYLMGRPPDAPGAGLVIFACSPAGLFEVRELEVRVPHLVMVDTSPYTSPLTRILDEYPRTAVVVVEKDRARIYVSAQQESAQTSELASEVQGKHSAGGWSQARFQRHVEFQFAEHVKRVLEEIQRLGEAVDYRRLAIGGPESAVNQLVRSLPEDVSARLAGTFPVDLKHETDDSILEKAAGLFEQSERTQETELVEQVVGAALSGGPGVLGLKPTVDALMEGRVRTLLVADGADGMLLGGICPHCDYFGPQPFVLCPLCGSTAEQTPDVVEVAMERALLSGARVESVRGDARERLMRESGGVAALLRY